MSLINLISQAAGGQGLAQLASQFGIDESKASELTSILAPALGSAAKKQAEGGGLADLLGSLKGEAQGGMFDDVAQAAAPEGLAQGKAFVEQLMGGAQGAEGLASEAAKLTGIDASTVAQFLPAMAAMLQGGMQKQLPDNALEGILGGRYDLWLDGGRRCFGWFGNANQDVGCGWRWLASERYFGQIPEVTIIIRKTVFEV